MKILFNYASRSRPENFRRGVESIVNNCVGDYEILAIVDANDERLREYNFDNCTVLNGISKNKIDAINRGRDYILKSDAQIIVNMSDDMVFTKKGFDDIIRYPFQDNTDLSKMCDDGGFEYYDNLDQCLHFPDQNQGSNCMTMSIMGIDYYKRDNFIYDPQFESLWCDIVAQEVAQLRGCYKFVNERIFDHLHPSFGQSHYDKQYRATEDWQVRQRDYQTYIKLKSIYDPTNHFPIRSI